MRAMSGTGISFPLNDRLRRSSHFLLMRSMANKKTNLGLIGLGIIGSRAAAGLRAAGFPVFVWNRTPQPVPNFLGSPAAVAELCPIIQIFVADAEAVFEVIEAMGDALTPKHLIICSATIGA